MSDKELLEESLEVLQRIPCQGWACEGPTLRPKHMITCFRCAHVATLAKRLGCYVPRSQRDLNKDESFRVPVGGWYGQRWGGSDG